MSVRAETQKPREHSPEESITVSPRVEEEAQSTVGPGEELEMKAQPPDSAVTGGTTHAASAPEPPLMSKTNEEEDGDGGDTKAPLDLIIQFLRAVRDRDIQLASRLCQMILIYEPDNPEASEFLPLIQKKLLEEQETEHSTEEEEEDEDDDITGSDEESSQSSSGSMSSCSSSSPSDDEEEDEERCIHPVCHPMCHHHQYILNRQVQWRMERGPSGVLLPSITPLTSPL